MESTNKRPEKRKRETKQEDAVNATSLGNKTFPALRKVGGARPKGTMNAEGNEDGTATQSISALASALQQLMVTQARPAAKRSAPQFSGSPEEDPETFLRKAEEYFQENTHQDDIVEAVAECLTKQAAPGSKR